MRQLLCVLLFMYGVSGQAWAQESAEISALRAKAESGNAKAQFDLGMIYADGKGVRLDYAEAIKWHRKAADQGSSNAQYKLGWIYYYSYGVSQDYAKAAKWYRKAADQGNANAQESLGLVYSEGLGVRYSNYDAYFWFSLSANQGHEGAILLKDKIAHILTPVQSAELKKRISEWKPVVTQVKQ